MKKSIIALFILLGLFACEEEELIIFDVDNGQTLAQFSFTSALMGTAAEGATLDVEVTVTTRSDSERTISIQVDPSSTASSDQYTISNAIIPAGAFVGSFTISSNFDALPDEGNTLLVLNITDVSNSNNVIFENAQLSITLFRECPILGGDWVIEMGDSYGDGWQTATNGGGPGLMVTLNTGEVFEVGLCTPYEANTYDCIAEFSFGTDVITFPDGVESAEWFWPGDFWGEISFDIFSPNGNLVASFGPGTPEGVLAIDYCLQ